MLGNKASLIKDNQLFDLTDDELEKELLALVLDRVNANTKISKDQINWYIGDDILVYFEETNWSLPEAVDLIGELLTESMVEGEISVPWSDFDLAEEYDPFNDID